MTISKDGHIEVLGQERRRRWSVEEKLAMVRESLEPGAIAKIHAPLPSHNSTLADSNIQEKYGVTVVGLKRANQDFQHATPLP